MDFTQAKSVAERSRAKSAAPKRVLGRLKQKLVFGMLFFSSWALGLTGSAFDYSGYFRAGTGSSVNGQREQCYSQPGLVANANEFRLGNECSVYGEAYLIGHMLRATQENPTFFDTRVALAYNPPGYTQYENQNFYLIEAYVEGGRFNGSPLIYWVGKRFYREPELYIDDFWYFADTSGNGGGVQNIPLFGGTLEIAALVESSTLVVTKTGVPRTLLLDTRLLGLPLSSRDTLNFWMGFASGTGGEGQTVHYDNTWGAVFGVRYDRQLSFGLNRLALVYGRGLMQAMTLSQTFGDNPAPVTGENTENESFRYRVVDDLAWNITPRYNLQLGAILETWNRGGEGSPYGRWLSLGVRHTYFFGKYFNIALETGASQVILPGQTPTTLFRATLAPEIMPAMDINARPTLRAFLTDTFGQGASLGVQAEAWF